MQGQSAESSPIESKKKKPSSAADFKKVYKEQLDAWKSTRAAGIQNVIDQYNVLRAAQKVFEALEYFSWPGGGEGKELTTWFHYLNEIGISLPRLSQYKKIATCPHLVGKNYRKYWHLLPTDWTTLYKLACLTEAQFLLGIGEPGKPETRKISPEMTGAQADELAGKGKKKPKDQDLPDQKDPVTGRPVSHEATSPLGDAIETVEAASRGSSKMIDAEPASPKEEQEKAFVEVHSVGGTSGDWANYEQPTPEMIQEYKDMVTADDLEIVTEFIKDRYGNLQPAETGTEDRIKVMEGLKSLWFKRELAALLHKYGYQHMTVQLKPKASGRAA